MSSGYNLTAAEAQRLVSESGGCISIFFLRDMSSQDRINLLPFMNIPIPLSSVTGRGKTTSAGKKMAAKKAKKPPKPNSNPVPKNQVPK